jgi:hypothetical protein
MYSIARGRHQQARYCCAGEFLCLCAERVIPFPGLKFLYATVSTITIAGNLKYDGVSGRFWR